MRGARIAIGIVAGLLAAAGAARADHPGAPTSIERDAPSAFLDARALTDRVRHLHARLNAAESTARAQALAEIVAAAQARARRLAALMEYAPSAVLQAALSARERSQFPPEVQAHLEAETAEEGELEVLHEDRWNEDRYVYALHTARGRLAVHFARMRPNLLTGDLVQVRGVRLGQAVAAEGGSTGVTLLSAALSNTIGEQRTLVIVLNFSNTTTYTSSTVTQAQNVTFSASSSASAYFREASYGETWLSGKVVGPFTIAMSSSSCDYYGLANLARSAAAASGVDLSLYRRYVYAFPANACGWWGLGTIGGNPSQAWINGSYQNGVVVHELGHNLGLFHSHALECGSVVVGGTCSSIEYGDTVDAMGTASPPYHFNAVQKELLGWLNNGSMPPVTHVQANGVYTIDPYEPDGSNPKALKIRTKNGDWYYVEYRQGVGFDAPLPSSVKTGVVVHLWKNQSGDGVYLLDMTPQTSSWQDPALQVNTTFADGANAISITPIWVNGTNAGVDVRVDGSGGSTCVRANPTIAVSPLTKQGSAGSRLSYTVSITNRDSNCTATTFTGQASKPSGWTAAFTATSLTIPAGSTASTVLDVVSATSAAPGDYPIGISAADSTTRTYSTSTTAIYGVSGTDGGGGSFSDDFNRADSNTLGSAWAQVAGGLFVEKGSARSATATTMHVALVAGLTGASQSAAARFTSTDNNRGPRFGLVLRQADPGNYYACYRQTGGSSNLRISRVTNGIETILARVSVPNPKKNVPFDLACGVQGHNLVLRLNGVPLAWASDATLASGRVGLMMGYPNSGGTPRSHIADNFTATAN